MGNRCLWWSRQEMKECLAGVEAVEVVRSGKILLIPCWSVGWSRNERRMSRMTESFASDLLRALRTPKSMIPVQIPALGPSTQQETDITIWWPELKEVEESVVSPGLYQWHSLPPDTGRRMQEKELPCPHLGLKWEVETGQKQKQGHMEPFQ